MSKRIFLGASALGLTMAVAGSALAQDQRVIASIVFQGDQFMKSLQQGVREAAEARGAEVLELNIDGDQAREAQAIDTYISRGVDAIVIAPLSATNSAGSLKRARDAGITVVALNGGLQDKSIANATFSTANYDLGASSGNAAAAFINSELGGEAQVGIMAFSSLLPEQSGARTGGFKDAVSKGNTVTVVTEQDAWMPEKAVQVATDMLTANPQINLLYAANEGGTVGAMQAVRNAGKAGKVYVFGIDGSEQLARGLMAGDNVLQATTAQSAKDMGAMGANAALDLLEGGSAEAETSVPALLLSRADPDGIAAFVESLK
ncbi:ABC-type sugar transport system substrate-binding protein [Labrenzia sp. EL_208]|nr:substrate-binding domain-containing protein [Roseibium album]MBG6147126.1 ABC-type sugar transport system substrate-binding protein [Labrenzia sp. EL_142]MBG6159787.1 ABC-type sugar transport system substrate-binding protein [Labrenzia sp. EL_162]MBG6165678.1 ABC-type sugar transport system substrate-binding protein [Labrenzia sp. EL_195]MBG6176553.1 ABC-type sugar transport system substrate-binding protein [Labrenzia sp. EL_132]MBG6198319.1 ABC-type sugar transport system substrate-binding